MPPYASDSQRRFFHSKAAKKKGISEADVKEFDEASTGMDLPEKVAETAETKKPKKKKLVY